MEKSTLKQQMTRREFLLRLAPLFSAALTGCTGNNGVNGEPETRRTEQPQNPEFVQIGPCLVEKELLEQLVKYGVTKEDLVGYISKFQGIYPGGLLPDGLIIESGDLPTLSPANTSYLNPQEITITIDVQDLASIIKHKLGSLDPESFAKGFRPVFYHELAHAATYPSGGISLERNTSIVEVIQKMALKPDYVYKADDGSVAEFYVYGLMIVLLIKGPNNQVLQSYHDVMLSEAVAEYIARKVNGGPNPLGSDSSFMAHFFEELEKQQILNPNNIFQNSKDEKLGLILVSHILGREKNELTLEELDKFLAVLLDVGQGKLDVDKALYEIKEMRKNIPSGSESRKKLAILDRMINNTHLIQVT